MDTEEKNERNSERPETGERPEASPLRDAKRRLTAGAVALVTSASVLLGGIFHSPALMPEELDLTPQVAYAESDEDDLDGSGDGGNDGGGEKSGAERAAEAEETASPPEVRDDERRRLRRGKLALKLLAIPLCAAVCWFALSGASALFAGVLGTVAAKLLAWALTAAALLLGAAAAIKAVFPDLPLKKIFNRRSISGVLIGGAALAAVDLLVPLFWAEYSRVEALVRAVGILAVIGTAAGSFARREKKRRDAGAAAVAAEPARGEESEAEAEKPMTREDILALADTVSRKK